MDDLRHLRQTGNPLTRAATRRQVWRQIYLPLLLVVVGTGALVALASVIGYGTVGAWADTAFVFLAIPLAVVLALLLGAMAGAVVLLARLMQEIPGFAGGLQDRVDQAARGVRRGSEMAVRPFILPRAVAGAAGEALRSARKLFRGPWGWPDE